MELFSLSLSLFFFPIEHKYLIAILALNKLKNLGNWLSKTAAIKSILIGKIISLPKIIMIGIATAGIYVASSYVSLVILLEVKQFVKQ